MVTLSFIHAAQRQFSDFELFILDTINELVQEGPRFESLLICLAAPHQNGSVKLTHLIFCVSVGRFFLQPGNRTFLVFLSFVTVSLCKRQNVKVFQFSLPLSRQPSLHLFEVAVKRRWRECDIN